ncbi:MAG TPA: L-seryl-tRNA(Sec) selenium transferase [Chloroflexia bacterium]|nr:L-seryl-tRNA(Sec) selenium transferase [Chloroflexia bacterium]
MRSLPSVDRVMSHPALAVVLAQLPYAVVLAAVREEIARSRDLLKQGATGAGYGPDDIAGQAAERALSTARPSLRHVINATGVIIHTNLGRSPLSSQAIEAMQRAAAYSNLEYDLDAGERGSRYTHAVQVLRSVTGCEDALIVNNNAAALVLVLACLAAGKEVVVSRGQLVEIGGGFRIPEIMSQSGARLVEVGTTNRTYTSDYERALTAETALLMRIHASNFRIVGFTEQPGLPELVQLARARDLLVVEDAGSGALIDTRRFGLAQEPLVQESLKAGADLVLFSGDKLLGGPQCGIIVGRQQVVLRLKKHPLARALRVDKLTLGALEATLLHYLKGEAEQQVPVWKMIAAPASAIKVRVERWAETLGRAGLRCRVEEGLSAIGGGSLPGETLPTWLLAVEPQSVGGSKPQETAGTMAELLRGAETPIIARVERGLLLLDPRTVADDEEETLLSVLRSCLVPRQEQRR